MTETNTKEKLVYFFGDGKADGNGGMKDLLGGKGAGLAEMTNAGVPVPPGFTITTDVCNLYYSLGEKVPEELGPRQEESMRTIETIVGKEFGNEENPLLVSVRSGAKFSMPGMMDTILNLGLNDKTVYGLANNTGNERFAWDSYRRLIQMFGKVVMEVDSKLFEETLSEVKTEAGVKLDTELTTDNLKKIVGDYKEIIKTQAGAEFPQDVWTQLDLARDAVFKSWNNERAITYRRLNDIPSNLGTAVNVQAMVFGNMGDTSATGVGFTRDPATGEKIPYGEYLTNAQGEDVVAGIRTPKPISELEKEMPEVYAQLMEITQRLEKHYRDIQDFEFTVENGKLYMLQTRNGKRTGIAAVKIAVDMVNEGVISKEDAVQRVEPLSLDQLLHPIFDQKELKNYAVIAKGIDASPGAAAGIVAFDAATAIKYAAKGEKVVLVRNETCPDDIEGMHVSQGVLTATGGKTSHAAVVGRQMGTPSVVGCGSVKINEHERTMTIGETTFKEGEYISIDGTTGQVYQGNVPTSDSDVIRALNGKDETAKETAKESEQYKNFTTILSWADEIRRLGVRANADKPKEAKLAVALGAEGIGLCRTEHMFFAEERIPIMQNMILAKTEEGRREYLAQLLPMQKEDFYGIFAAMDGKPVTIRLLDPPLHEFLPKREKLMVKQAKARNRKTEKYQANATLLERINELHEFNPMLGTRGCRLGILMPEITEMQTEAIIAAACEAKQNGYNAIPEIMVPLVGNVKELEHQKKIIDSVAKRTMEKYPTTIDYKVGTMIELPKAALTAHEIANSAEFFSFGTNDLTQMTLGLSRDDTEKKIVNKYQQLGIMETNPFETIDSGVAKLIELGTTLGRETRENLKVGICGEHGGDPKSIAFCDKVGMDYVSCSPLRVPIARLAAAQAALKSEVHD